MFGNFDKVLNAANDYNRLKAERDAMANVVKAAREFAEQFVEDTNSEFIVAFDNLCNALDAVKASPRAEKKPRCQKCGMYDGGAAHRPDLLPRGPYGTHAFVRRGAVKEKGS